MEYKICPLMSRSIQYDKSNHVINDGKVPCLEAECQFWTTVRTVEGDAVDGCAISNSCQT